MSKTHFIGNAEDALLDNLSALTSDDPSLKAGAQLNRELINVFDKWLYSQIKLNTHPAAVTEAAITGMATIVGTVLLNLDSRELRDKMCDHLLITAARKILQTKELIEEQLENDK